MSLFHAVVWIDHQKAQVLQFDAEHVQAQKVKAHSHHTAYHGSVVRTQHEFFGEVCDVLAGITEVLITGPRTGLDDFRHYADKHRPETAKQIVGYETAHLMTTPGCGLPQPPPEGVGRPLGSGPALAGRSRSVMQR